jgi:hypothetical protein
VSNARAALAACCALAVLTTVHTLSAGVACKAAHAKRRALLFLGRSACVTLCSCRGWGYEQAQGCNVCTLALLASERRKAPYTLVFNFGCASVLSIGVVVVTATQNPLALTGGLTPPIWESVIDWKGGIDWITATTRSGVLWDVWPDRCFIEDLREQHNSIEVQRWSTHGYEGYQVPGFRWGERHDGTIRTASSNRAQEYALFAVTNTMPIRLTRLDVALDIQTGMDPSIISASYATMEPSATRNGRRPKVISVDAHGDGYTTYLGSQASERRVRIYDKWRERGKADEWKGVVRIELQCRDDVAKRTWDTYRCAENRERACAAIVLDCLLGWGYPVPDLGCVPCAPRIAEHSKTDRTNSRLSWLRDQVQPALRTLCQEGYAEAAREALGLDSIPGPW